MRVLVKATKIIDGNGAEPIEKGAVLIADKTIVQVGRQSEIKAEAGTHILDAEGKTVIPGLIDCHTHYFGTSQDYHKWTHESYVPREITKSILLGVRNAQRCIRAGVLTFRDAGCTHTGVFQIRDEVNSGKMLGPRTLVSGTPIATTAGHAWGMDSEADGPVGVRKAVRNMLRWGPDAIKFMITGGAGTQYEEITQVQFTLEELKAGVEEAKKRNKRTLGHVGNSEGAILAVEAGLDSIDHGTILNDQALNAIKTSDSFYVPTLLVYWLNANKGAEFGISEWIVSKSKAIVDSHKEVFQKAYKMGINIAAGTDLGGDKNQRQVEAGYHAGAGLIGELELMVKYGMSPLDAIKAATLMASRNLGIEGIVGTLEKGKLADLVIVDGDPSENICDLRRVYKVMKEGQIVYET